MSIRGAHAASELVARRTNARTAAPDIETPSVALRRTSGITVHHWCDADNRNDIDGLAARIAALDLVISVGNANVHLAGALGVPAWSLLPAHGGWRWLAGRSGHAGNRQVPDCEVALVTGNGGTLSSHNTALLGKAPS